MSTASLYIAMDGNSDTLRGTNAEADWDDLREESLAFRPFKIGTGYVLTIKDSSSSIPVGSSIPLPTNVNGYNWARKTHIALRKSTGTLYRVWSLSSN